VTIVADATFFGRKRDKLGVLVFKDILEDEILIWKHIESEKLIDYIHLKHELIDKGFIIKGITVDGKRGLFRALEAYPVQMCHFHQRAIILRYLTKRPKLEASIELKKIVSRLTTTTETRFKNSLDDWYQEHEGFVNEKTVNLNTGKTEFTHRKLMASYRSLRKNLPYLFTYKNYPYLHMANTTNPLDGGVFTQLKKLIKLHQGISKNLKVKLVDDYLVNYNKKE